jgi:phospholipid/cholesterol/gamma-HCH transport system ATP-binding protein
VNADWPILEFRGVTAAAEPPYESGLAGTDLVLRAGELACFCVSERQGAWVFADAAEGLVRPGAGAVLFEGEDWAALGADRAADCRSRIGRVFETRGWLSNLDMDENVTLPQRYHTARPLSEIEAEAQAMARAFGFADLPRARPALLRRDERRRAEWIRAFLGSPSLVILEFPMRDVYADALPRLAEAVGAARRRGAAVIWIDAEESRRGLEALKPARIYGVDGEAWARAGGESG